MYEYRMKQVLLVSFIIIFMINNCLFIGEIYIEEMEINGWTNPYEP